MKTVTVRLSTELLPSLCKIIMPTRYNRIWLRMSLVNTQPSTQTRSTLGYETSLRRTTNTSQGHLGDGGTASADFYRHAHRVHVRSPGHLTRFSTTIERQRVHAPGDSEGVLLDDFCTLHYRPRACVLNARNCSERAWTQITHVAGISTTAADARLGVKRTRRTLYNLDAPLLTAVKVRAMRKKGGIKRQCVNSSCGDTHGVSEAVRSDTNRCVQ